jgi:hypothetical protein
LFLLLALPHCAGIGCAVLGPAAIRNGRAAYNDALIATNNEQVLAMIVRWRYGEPSGLLAVTSVTANLHIQSTIGAEFGIGSESNYEGNLTPLSAGIAYEENPTISYAPVQGEKYLRQLLSPLPLDLTVLLLGGLGQSAQAATLLIKGVNELHSPEFVFDTSAPVDPRLTRLFELLAGLSREGCVTWAQEAGSPPGSALVFQGSGARYVQQVEELYGLLGFAAPHDFNGVIILPIRMGVGKPGQPALQLRTRSLFELFNIAAASVEVPEEHLRSGLAPAIPPSAVAGREVRIRGSKWCPRQAMTAVTLHGWCYSIDGTDAPSKLTFRILEVLLSVRMAEVVDKKAAPILTVPASR